MIRALLVLAICSTAACDDKAGKKDPPATKKEAKKESKAPEKPAKAAEQHFDISHDKSGALARAAAVLEADGIDNEDLAAISHHAEKTPTAAVLCKHMAKIRGDEGAQAECVKELEHHVAKLGPELFGEAAACVMRAKTVPELDACVAAEEEAEEKLHTEKHGDGLDKATCDKLFEKFEALAMKDAGDQADHVKEVLEEVRSDVVVGCMEQGSKAEIECAEKSKTLHELKECAANLL